MASRGLNKVMLIGNLTRDPELRYTPSGVAVCTFGVATNRSWTTQSGETRDDAQFHRIVAWNKLAELCSQLLVKGRRVYVEGRIQYREYVGNDEVKKQVSEIIIEDMTILDSRRTDEAGQNTTLDQEEPKQDDDVQFDVEEQESKTDTKEKPSDKDKSSDSEEEMPF
jgi:single-strand DNA-binding protein